VGRIITGRTLFTPDYGETAIQIFAESEYNFIYPRSWVSAELPLECNSFFQLPITIINCYSDLFGIENYRPSVKRSDDYEARLRIAKMIGLSEVPKPSSGSLMKLSGILSDKIKSELIDAVEVIREVRGS
jgi:hypothetical protein